MAILNFRVTKITGEKKSRITKQTSVKANSAIVSVKKDKAEGAGEYLHVNFRYEVKYDPDLGEIVLEGTLWYTHPKLKDQMEDKKDKIQLKNEAVQEISTAIVRESLLESLDIARKLNLPAPINLPRVEIKAKTVDFKKAE